MNHRSDPRGALTGPTGVPAGSGYFDLTLAGKQLHLAPGRCYVNGRVCVLDEAQALQIPRESPAPSGVYLIYVDAFEQDPARDDPFYAQRPALGQPHPYGDGLRTLWEAKPLLLRDSAGEPVTTLAAVDPRAFESGWRPPEAARGELQARPNADIATDALYRVEIHAAPADAIWFKSSANNGMTASRLLTYRQEDEGHFLDLETTTDAYPQGQAFVPGKWVEVIQQHSATAEQRFMAQIVAVAATSVRVTWLSDTAPTALAGPGATQLRTIVRQWDRLAKTTADTVVGLDADSGRNTVEVRFQLGADQVFEPGDFWLIHASAEQNTLLWPLSGSADDGFVGPARPPDGVVHHYCPVAYVRRDDVGWAGEVKPVLPQLETITQVATTINANAPSDGRVPTERAVTAYVEQLRQEIEYRLRYLQELGKPTQAPPDITRRLAVPAAFAAQNANAQPAVGYHIKGALHVQQSLQVAGRVSDETGAVMPVGGIIMWSGAVKEIPHGFQLCDGTHGTPDLRARFIVGVDSDKYQPQSNGEADAHRHSINAPAQTFTAEESGLHDHGMPSKWRMRGDYEVVGGTMVTGVDPRGAAPENSKSQESGKHRHEVKVNLSAFNSAGSSPAEVRPRWYALCFIMKV